MHHGDLTMSVVHVHLAGEVQDISDLSTTKWKPRTLLFLRAEPRPLRVICLNKLAHDVQRIEPGDEVMIHGQKNHIQQSGDAA